MIGQETRGRRGSDPSKVRSKGETAPCRWQPQPVVWNRERPSDGRGQQIKELPPPDHKPLINGLSAVIRRRVCAVKEIRVYVWGCV